MMAIRHPLFVAALACVLCALASANLRAEVRTALETKAVAKAETEQGLQQGAEQQGPILVFIAGQLLAIAINAAVALAVDEFEDRVSSTGVDDMALMVSYTSAVSEGIRGVVYQGSSSQYSSCFGQTGSASNNWITTEDLRGKETVQRIIIFPNINRSAKTQSDLAGSVTISEIAFGFGSELTNQDVTMTLTIGEGIFQMCGYETELTLTSTQVLDIRVGEIFESAFECMDGNLAGRSTQYAQKCQIIMCYAIKVRELGSLSDDEVDEAINDGHCSDEQNLASRAISSSEVPATLPTIQLSTSTYLTSSQVESFTVLIPNDSLTNGDTRFVFQTDGNVVVYVNNRAKWATGTNGSSKCGRTTDNQLWVTADGRLVLICDDRVFWSSGSSNGQANGPYKLTVQGDNNVVLYNANGRAVWATGTN